MHRKRVLVNAYTHVNLGDDLFLKILFEKFPDTEFTIIGNKSKYEIIFKDDRISYISFPDAVKIKYVRKIFAKFFKYQYFKYQFAEKKKFLSAFKSEYDAVVTIGGSIFIENNIKNSFNFGNHKLLVDVFANTPKFFIGSNFGPYHNESYLNFFTNLFKKCVDVCFRDVYSKSLFNELPNVRNFPDVVFSGNFVEEQKIPKTVGISVMDFSRREKLSEYNGKYQKLIIKILKLQIDKGNLPYLFSFCEYEGDEKAIDEILELMDKKYSSKITKIFYKGDIDTFLKCFSQMETMYASRFHAMILSLMYEQNVHPIIYSKKMSDVLEDLNYQGKYTDLKNIDLSCDTSDIKSNDSFLIDNNTKWAADRHFEVLTKFINP